MALGGELGAIVVFMEEWIAQNYHYFAGRVVKMVFVAE